MRSVQFSSDSAQILTSSDDKLVKLHDIQRLKFKTSFKGIANIVLCSNRTEIPFLIEIDFLIIDCPLGHTNWVRSAKLSNDDRMIVSGSDDRTVRSEYWQSTNY